MGPRFAFVRATNLGECKKSSGDPQLAKVVVFGLGKWISRPIAIGHQCRRIDHS